MVVRYQTSKKSLVLAWKSYFDNLFNLNIPTQSPDSVESGTDDLPFSPELSMLNEPFTEQEVELAIQNINTNQHQARMRLKSHSSKTKSAPAS